MQITAENGTEGTIYLNYKFRRSTTSQTAYDHPSATAIMFAVLWTEYDGNLCIIFNCGNSFNKNKPKIDLTQKKSRCEEFLKEKRKTFYWYMFPFHLVQYANNECHDTLRNRRLLKCLKWSVLGK